jgi:prepilin-type N-terminal cleavage/methylation domain-containing protein
MKRHSGFTLVEMMVVIGIIVLLAGIVYAAMGPAREKARQVACASNLRQIHRALMMYAADYDGTEPEGRKTYWQLGLPPPIASGPYANGGPLTTDYLKDPRLWICPNDPCTFMVKIHPECASNPRRCCESYVSPLHWDDPAHDVFNFPDAVEKCGQRLPLFYCPYHGEDQGVSSFVLVLRWNGRVEGVYRQTPWTPCLN